MLEGGGRSYWLAVPTTTPSLVAKVVRTTAAVAIGGDYETRRLVG